MKGESAYKAAFYIAAEIEKQFRKKHSNNTVDGYNEQAPVPDEGVIEKLIDTSFWASLRREEGRNTRISLAYVPHEMSTDPVLFKEPLVLSPGVLTKIGPGVEQAGTHLGVWHQGDELIIWGVTMHVPDLCFVIDVSEPGLVVIKHRRINGFGKYANVAVLNGDQVKMLYEAKKTEENQGILSASLGFEIPMNLGAYANTLILLAVAMRSHKRGGGLLIVPEAGTEWQNSIIHPVSYQLDMPFYGLARELIKDKAERSSDVIRREVENIARLTAIDGVTIINNRFALQAFGAKITRKADSQSVNQVYVTEPIVGKRPAILHPAQLGGTRHLSAAQFVYDQRDAIAMIASQDDTFTMFLWSEEKAMVQGHRIDTLLL